MTPGIRPRNSRDRGTVLPIALVLTVVLGGVVAAIAAYTATSLRTTRVTEGRVDRLAAAEAGAQSALINLSTTGQCISSITQVGDVSVALLDNCSPTPIVNSDLGDTYGLVVTGVGLGTGTDAFNRQGGSTTLEIGGSLYLGLGVGASSQTGQRVEVSGPVTVTRGTCEQSTVPLPNWISPTTPGQVAACDTAGWEAQRPAPVITVPPAPPPISSPGCTVRTPGTYTTLDTSPAQPNYLVSGVYVISGLATLRGNVTGGFHSSGAALPDSHPCAAAQQADRNQGTAEGVVLVLVDQGRIEIVSAGGNNDETSVTIHGLSTGTRYVSVAAFPQSGAFAASSRDPNSSPVISKSGPQVGFTFLGEVWAPGGFVNIGNISSNDAHDAAFLGGLTVSRLSLNFSAQIDGVYIGDGTSVSATAYRVRSRATSPDGGTTTVSAVAEIPLSNGSPNPSGLTVRTWRVE